MSKVLAIAVEAFVNRAGLSPNAIGDLKKYEGYLEESRAILAFLIGQIDFSEKGTIS